MEERVFSRRRFLGTSEASLLGLVGMSGVLAAAAGSSSGTSRAGLQKKDMH